MEGSHDRRGRLPWKNLDNTRRSGWFELRSRDEFSQSHLVAAAPLSEENPNQNTSSTATLIARGLFHCPQLAGDGDHTFFDDQLLPIWDVGTT